MSKAERSGVMEEKTFELMVIDEGIDEETQSDVRVICCMGAIFPFRG